MTSRPRPGRSPTHDTTHGRLCRQPDRPSDRTAPHRTASGQVKRWPSAPADRDATSGTARSTLSTADLVVRSGVICPISVLSRSVSTSRCRLELAQRWSADPLSTDCPWSTRVLDGGTIISSTPCISPGRWRFSWGSSGQRIRLGQEGSTKVLAWSVSQACRSCVHTGGLSPAWQLCPPRGGCWSDCLSALTAGRDVGLPRVRLAVWSPFRPCSGDVVVGGQCPQLGDQGVAFVGQGGAAEQSRLGGVRRVRRESPRCVAESAPQVRAGKAEGLGSPRNNVRWRKRLSISRLTLRARWLVESRRHCRRGGHPRRMWPGYRALNVYESRAPISTRTPSWSWGESNPRPSAGERTCYDHSRCCH